MEKEDPNLITVFICFLRSGLRFTRYDTNNVGLAFIEEIKKHNPNFKPVKVTQRERDQEYIVNAYPKEFEQLINSLIEEYRIKHKLEYRLKKPKHGGRKGGFNRGGRPGGQYRDSRNSGSSYRNSGENQGGYDRRREGDSRSVGYRRSDGDQSGQGDYRPRRTGDEQRSSGFRERGERQFGQGGYQRRNRDGQLGSNYGGYQQRDQEGRRSAEGEKRPRTHRPDEDRFIPNRYSAEKGEKPEENRPKRPRKDPDKE